MVKTCSPQEFDRRVHNLIREQAVSDPWQRNDALKGILNGLRRHDYFCVIKSESSLKNDPMFEIWAEYPTARREPDWVQRDLSNIWGQLTVRAIESYSAVRKTPEGFESLLLAHFHGSFLTGRISVSGVQIDRNLAMGKNSDRFF